MGKRWYRNCGKQPRNFPRNPNPMVLCGLNILNFVGERWVMSLSWLDVWDVSLFLVRFLFVVCCALSWIFEWEAIMWECDDNGRALDEHQCTDIFVGFRFSRRSAVTLSAPCFFMRQRKDKSLADSYLSWRNDDMEKELFCVLFFFLFFFFFAVGRVVEFMSGFQCGCCFVCQIGFGFFFILHRPCFACL